MLGRRLAGMGDRLVAAGRLRTRQAKARYVRQVIDGLGGARSVLFVGVGQGWTPLDTVVERAAAQGAEVVVGTDLHRVSNVPWPYLVADGLRLPFADGAFDVVLSNAVIEHVGDEQAQRRFVAEQLRVGRLVLITTPNRWFPLESHTRAVLRHWSPGWRARHEHVFTRLLSRSELAALLPPGSSVHGHAWSPTFVGVTQGSAGDRSASQVTVR